MRKIVSFVLLSSFFLLSSTVFATPVSYFEAGKSTIDIGITRPELKFKNSSGYAEYNKKTNFDFGITTGINDKIALQYKYQKSEPSFDFLLPPYEAKVQEFNVLYSLNPDVYAFAGAQRFSHGIPLPGAPKGSKTVAQAGITSVAKLSDKLNGWATAAAGNDNYSYEIGVGYTLSNAADLNLFYRYKKFKDIEFFMSPEPVDTKIKGLGASVTVKF